MLNRQWRTRADDESTAYAVITTIGAQVYFFAKESSGMALILKKRESGFRNWYENNQQRLSEKRKKRYAEDPEYRQRALEASRTSEWCSVRLASTRL